MRTAKIYSVCECQARLGAELDEQKHVIRGWARERATRREDRAPAHSIDASESHFDIAWACPFCIRNVLRSFDTSGLVWQQLAAK